MLGRVAWLTLGLSAILDYLQAIPGRKDVVLYEKAHPVKAPRVASAFRQPGPLLVFAGWDRGVSS